MKKLHEFPLPVTVVAALVLVALSQSATASTMTAVEQERLTNAFVIVPPCQGEDFEFEEALNFLPFRSQLEAASICDFAQGLANATQQSQITPGLLSASGATTADALTVNPTVIHSISSSYFEVTFEVSETGVFEIAGELSAEGGAPVVLSGAGVTLSRPGGPVIVQESVEPEANGDRADLSFAQQVELQPGTYELSAQAASVIDSTMPPNGEGAASFTVTLRAVIVGDLDENGLVDGTDLGALLLAWGDCPRGGSCPADLDFDGVIDGADLGALLLNWTD